MGEQSAQDAVQFADQLGRLDFVTAILACIAVILGLGTIPVFLFLKYHAGQVAKRSADKKLKGAIERIEREAISRLESMLPGLVEDYQALARGAVSGATGDEIADAQEDDQR